MAEEQRGAPAVMTKNDCLWFVECFRDKSIKEAYLRTQEIMSRAELDAHNLNTHNVDF